MFCSYYLTSLNTHLIRHLIILTHLITYNIEHKLKKTEHPPNNTHHTTPHHTTHPTLRGGDKDDLKALVIDMRNNGGGLLQGAVETANLLLPPG